MKNIMMRKRIYSFLQDEGGGYTIFGLFIFILLVGIGGLAVDGTNGFRVQTIMQATADASAHAAVIDLPDQNAAMNTALNFAAENMPADTYGTVLAANDVEFGNWDPNTRTFTPSGASPNAVRVTLRSTRTTGNGVPVSFLRIIGLRSWDVVVQAVAMANVGEEDCVDNGFFTGAKLNGVGSSNSFSGVCVHGQSELQVNSSVTIADGAIFSTKSYSNLIGPGSGTTPMVEGDNFIEWDYIPPLPAQISSYIVPGLRDQSITPPPFITRVENTGGGLPCDLVPGTMYIIKDDEKIKGECQGNYVHDIAVVSTGKLDVGEYMTLENVLLATTGEMTIGTGSTLGSPSYCEDGGGNANGAVFLFAGNTLSMNSSITYSGVQAVSNHELWVGSDSTGQAFSISNSSTMGINSSGTWTHGCRAPSLLGGTPSPSGEGAVTAGWYLVQ